MANKNGKYLNGQDFQDNLDHVHQLASGCFLSVLEVAAVVAAPYFVEKDVADTMFSRIRKHLSNLALTWVGAELIPFDVRQRLAQTTQENVTICGTEGTSAHEAVFLLGQQILLPFMGAMQELISTFPDSYRRPPVFAENASHLFANFLPFLRVIYELGSKSYVSGKIKESFPTDFDFLQIAESVLVEQMDLTSNYLGFLSPLAALDNTPPLAIVAKLKREFITATVAAKGNGWATTQQPEGATAAGNSEANLPQNATETRQDDNEHDKKKKSCRPLTSEVRDCIRRYRAASKGPDKTSMKAVVELYVEENGGSVSSLIRTLNDHSDFWKNRLKHDKKDDKIV